MTAKSLKILAIDDNPDNLTTLRAVVNERLPTAKVFIVSNGRKGLDLAFAYDPDVILLDIVMPEMDGFEVCRRLKDDQFLHAIPVVFLTALRTDRENRIRALEIGAESFLSKPFDEVEIIAQIRAMAKIKAANRLPDRKRSSGGTRQGAHHGTAEIPCPIAAFRKTLAVAVFPPLSPMNSTTPCRA